MRVASDQKPVSVVLSVSFEAPPEMLDKLLVAPMEGGQFRLVLDRVVVRSVEDMSRHPDDRWANIAGEGRLSSVQMEVRKV
jgi:hypothetical protein